MPENSNPQVVAFANNKVRPLADKLVGLYYSSKSLIAEYAAGDIGTKIEAAGAGELLADGSAVDGRTRITGGDIYNIVTAAQQLVNFVENQAVATADRLTVITKPHVN